MELPEFKDNKIESKEQFRSEILLHFFRHSIKEKDENKDDTEIELTDEGKERSKGFAEELQGPAMVFGSPRVRSKQTAAYHAFGKQPEISGSEPLAELFEKIDKDIVVGSHIGTNKHLDFHEAKDSEYADRANAAYRNKELLKFIVEESDQLAQEFGDETSFSYSRNAAQIAQILQKYLKVSDRWDGIAQGDKYDSNTLERFMGSHQSVAESFLAKVIELKHGEEERDKFVGLLNGGEGFDFNEGFDLSLQTKNNDSKVIEIAYEKKDEQGNVLYSFSESLTPQIIQAFIDEAQS